MRYLFIVVIYLLVVGCATSEQNSEQGFYTWVDASGQVRTTPRAKKTEAEVSDSNEEKESIANNSSKALNEIDASEYTPAEDMDKKLKGERLYAWTEDGRQQISEQAAPTPDEMQDSGAKPLSLPVSQQILKSDNYKKNKIHQWSQVAQSEFKLKDYYQYNESTKKDVLIIDIFEAQPLGVVQIVSFDHNGSLAYPALTQLDSSFQVLPQTGIEWLGYSHETWSQYGRLTGRFTVHPKASFLLLSTQSQSGLLEVGEKIVKLVDLGSIVLTPYE
ncbi:hypothetical protein [Bermanella sp. R86510]|uniref:hypothetical protein n=1 Tax=unclassified Bermanella TaxID=2627862 RepID=UPI0037C54546